MTLLRIGLLTLTAAIAIVPPSTADTFQFNMTSPTLDAHLIITASHGATNDLVTGVRGTFWELAMGGTPSANSRSGVFTAIPAAIGIDPITGAVISPVSTSACSAGGQAPPACFTNGEFYYDDVIYPAKAPGAGSVDWGGILFGVPGTGFELNILSYAGTFWYWTDNGGTHMDYAVVRVQPGSGLAAVSPEPGTLLLLATGLLGLARLIFGRANQPRGRSLS